MLASMASKPRPDLEAGDTNVSLSSQSGTRNDVVVAGDRGASFSSPPGIGHGDLAVAANVGDQLAISYRDADIDAILAEIDKSVPDSAPSHIRLTEGLNNFCHDAVCTMREFRDEIVQEVTKAIPSLPDGDPMLLHPGTGPQKLGKALRDALLFTEATAIDADTAKFGIPVGQATPTLSDVVFNVQRAVLSQVNRVTSTAKKRLEIVSGLVGGPLDIRVGYFVVTWVLEANGRVKEWMTQRVADFYKKNVEGHHRESRMEEMLGRVLSNQDETGRDVKDMRRDVREMARNLRSLTLQIAEVLTEVNAMRIHQKEGICPQGFILIPKVWKDRSLVEELASFNLYARDVQLFFVCRMFFEELEAVADVEDTIYEHEFSDPMILQLPRDMVTKHQHLISLSVKIVNVLVKASALGCGINLIPHVDISDHNELLTALQTHLLEVQAHAENDTPAAGGWKVIKMNRERLREVLRKIRRNRPTPGNEQEQKKRLMRACKAFQDYLEKRPNQASAWQDIVRPKLVCTKKHDGKEFGYICKDNDEHHRKWTQAPQAP